MGKKGKKKQKKQNQTKGGTQKKTTTATDPIFQLSAKKDYKKTSPLGEKVRHYKENTTLFKSGLQSLCVNEEFFQNDVVKSIGKAVDFLCEEEANNKDICAALIPSLRDAIQGRIDVASFYSHRDTHSTRTHQFFLGHLKEQYVKLAKITTPISRPFPDASIAHYVEDVEGPGVEKEPYAVVACRNEQLGDQPDERSSFSTSSPLSLLRQMKNLQQTNTMRWDESLLKNLLLLAVTLDDNELLVWLLQLDMLSGSSRRKLMMHLMLSASSLGMQKIIDSLTRLGCPVDGPDYNGETPILFAAHFNHVGIVKHFVQHHGVNVNSLCGIQCIEEIKRPLLHNLVKGTISVQMLDVLFECGANPNERCVDNTTALHHAAQGPNAYVVQALLKAGAEVNARGGITDETPLHTAAVWGRTENLKFLLQSGADVHSRNNMQDMPIHLACEDGHVDVVKTLVKGGCNIDARDENHDTPLMLAIKYKHEELAITLVHMGASVNLSNSIGPIIHKALRNKQYALAKVMLDCDGGIATTRENDGETPLHSLCRYQDSPVSVMTLLLRYGADINAKMEDDVTPLYWAFAYGNITLAHTLIEQRADLFAKDSNGTHPLAIAVGENVWKEASISSRIMSYANSVIQDEDISRLKNLLDAMPIFQKNAMLDALRSRNLEMVDLVLDSGFPLETSMTPVHDTALLIATQQRDIDIARRLLEKGADVDCKDRDGFRCLHVAVGYGDREMTTLFIKNGVSVNVFTNEGESPLYKNLRETPSLAIVKLLVESGAIVNQTRSPVFTPLHAASYGGFTDIAVYLLQNGADMECRSFNEMTPLLYACKHGHLETAKVLIEKGADVNAKLPDGKSILTHACLDGHESIVRLLLLSGIEFDAEALRAARQIGNEGIINRLLEDHFTVTPPPRNPTLVNGNTALVGALLIAWSAWALNNVKR